MRNEVTAEWGTVGAALMVVWSLALAWLVL
jgi:hypothetical protein